MTIPEPAATIAPVTISLRRDDVIELLWLLERARPHVASWAEAEHMFDGFGPRVERDADRLLVRVDAMLSRSEEIAP